MNMKEIVYNVSVTSVENGGKAETTQSVGTFNTFTEAYTHALDLVDKVKERGFDYEIKQHPSNDTIKITAYSKTIGNYYEVKVERKIIN